MVYCMRITLDAAYPGIVEECCAALESIFPGKTAHPGVRRKCNCVRRRESQAVNQGLIHSDGTRIIATERKGSYVRRAPRYAFSNKSEDIKRLFCESCDAVGVRWTRPSDRQIAIYRKMSVALLDEFVGPKR
jgi:hypothetical protein